MSNKQGSSNLVPVAIMSGAAAMLIAGAVMTLSPRSAQATPAYAGQTHLACGACHVNKAGGGPLTDQGKSFAANGHKMP